MKIDTNAIAIDRLAEFAMRRGRPAGERPWPHSVKTALWVSLAAASWGVVILVGYSIWLAL